MKASVTWINQYLDGPPLSPDETERLLTEGSFPIDAREELAAGDARLEVEVTSNRGDCLSHFGLARELAARTGRKLLRPPLPELRRGTKHARDLLSLENRLPDLCPRFTVHIIRGVKIGPSPAWLRQRLEAVGQRSINNIVDVTNFLTHELGHPCHAFDLARLAGNQLIIRMAQKGETLTTLDGKKRTLAGDEVVVADSKQPQSLAGIIGGGDSEVTDTTTDVVLEMATWSPTAVRRASRRHQVRTDASHRFERYVDPREIDFAAARAHALMLEVAGGELAEGILDQGAPPPTSPQITLRPDRCRALIGADIPDHRITEILTALEITVSPSPGLTVSSPPLTCTPPPFRPDLTREVDLIEEVARMHGLEKVPRHERMSVVVKHPQESELRIRELARVLTGLGFYETVTFSFISREAAAAFIADSETVIAVDDERRKHEPALRPSILPGLLTCRRANQDAGVHIEGGIRLFELSATFAGVAPTEKTIVPGVRERRRLALLIDVPGAGKGKQPTIDQQQTAVRILRGTAEAIADAMCSATLEVRPAATPHPAISPGTSGELLLDGRVLGAFGIIDPRVQSTFGLDIAQAALEIDLDPLVSRPAPTRRPRPLPAFPPIERDLSLIVAEDIRWQQMHTLVETARLERLEHIEFVGSYRGKQTGPGKKSVTLRLRFRDPARTLRHEEVDPQVEAVIQLASRELGATLRG